MTDFCAIEADYVNWRPVNGRKVLQLVFEVPLENTHDVLTRLGTPTPGESKWVAIALLDRTKLVRDTGPHQSIHANGEHEVSGSATAQAEGGSPKKSWSDYTRSQQAAILSTDADFIRYFDARSPNDATGKLKAHFRISSRTELDHPKNHAGWDEFVALYHLARDRLK